MYTFPDGNHRTYQALPVHLMYAPTGDFEKFSIATMAISHTIHMGHILNSSSDTSQRCTTVLFG